MEYVLAVILALAALMLCGRVASKTHQRRRRVKELRDMVRRSSW